MSDLEQHLAAQRDRLTRLVRHEAQALLRHESESDLVAGITLRALERRDQFEYRGERQFLSWLYGVARQHLVSRIRYFRAARRDGGFMLRITQMGSRSRVATRGVEVSGAGLGPATLAERKELVELASRAIRLLPARDRRIIEWTREELPLEDLAERLRVSYDAAKQARRRAVERFRKLFNLVRQGPQPDSRRDASTHEQRRE